MFDKKTNPNITEASIIKKQGSQPSSSTDLLHLKNEPRLTCLLSPKQLIIGSYDVMKFNAANKCQSRIFLITDTAVYNIILVENFIKSMMSKLVSFQNKYSIRRKIRFETFEGITLSNQPYNLEFVIHVYNEYDYRIKAPDYKSKVNIMKTICHQFQKITKKKLAFYFSNDVTLQKKWRQKGQSTKKRKFDSDPIYLDLQDLIDYEPGVNFQLLYSWDNQKIDIASFKSMNAIQFLEGYQYFSITKREAKFEKIKQNFQNHHPFICLPAYVYQTESTLYLLKHLYIGGRMDKLILENGPIHKELFTFYMAQLILALQYLHSQGWVYCSLNLDNIYIKSNGYIELEGIGRYMRHKKTNKQKFYGFVGRDWNLAPQVIMCEGYDEQADIWQLGICAYIMLKGFHPYMTSNKKDMMKKIMFEPLPQDKSLPNFIKKLLEPSTQKRIKNIGELKKDEWFKDMKWEKLMNEQIDSLYIPEIKSVAEWKGKMPSIVYIDNEQ